MNSKPILYIKAGCPWCLDALDFFSAHGVEVDVKDVRDDREAMRRMMEISRQTLTPTFEYEDFVVPDFGVDEFKRALAARPDIQKELGLETAVS